MECALRTLIGRSGLCVLYVLSFACFCCVCDARIAFVLLILLIRNLIIKCNGYRQSQWWNSEIKHLAETCDFLKTQRFEGFAPPRENTLTKWSVM